MNKAVISVNKAKCRDCYLCVRHCPVKAIKMSGGQAYIEESRCILCGRCVKICPQKAKSYRNDVDKVKDFIEQGCTVVASLAPSYAAVHKDWEIKRIPAVLKLLGFSYVEDSSLGALYTAMESLKVINDNPEKSFISSACPAVVNYIEKYKPGLMHRLIPVASPMITHGRLMKRKYGNDCKVVFIGPCIAKKAEAERPGYEGIIDAVITFEELNEWMKTVKLNTVSCEESGFDNKFFYPAVIFPLPGGLLKTAMDTYNSFSTRAIAVDGFDATRDAFDYISANPLSSRIVEPLMCRSGCIDGPGINTAQTVVERKAALLEYYNNLLKKQQGAENSEEHPPIDMSALFYSREIKEKEYTDKEINDILLKIGKAAEEDRLNCGACGYNSCVEKAKAVLGGMAEVEMCIPYMRYISEKRTDKIIESTPNGIVILDDEFSILHMNASFKKFFKCDESLVGKSISALMDIEPYEELAAGDKEIIETTKEHPRLKLVFHELLYKLKDDNQIVGIFVDITKNLADRQKLDSLRENTLIQAQELLGHQIEMAQKLAKYLGESTAKGESLVNSLMELTEDEEKRGKSPRKNWLWDTYMLK